MGVTLMLESFFSHHLFWGVDLHTYKIVTANLNITLGVYSACLFTNMKNY